MLKKIEEDARHSLHSIEKYFDRINEKLFEYQLLIFAGYIAIATIPKTSIPIPYLLIPIFCIIRLIMVEYSMMEYHRKMSNIMELSSEQRKQISEKSNKATLQSLEVVLESMISTICFIVVILKYNIGHLF